MSAPQNVFTGSYFEQDARWSAVDAYTISHLDKTSAPIHDALQSALANSIKRGLPDISSFPTQSKFIALQCRIGKVQHALEVGTLGGYTSIWIASQNPSIRITTVEIDPKHAEVARENIRLAGVADRVDVVLGAGLDVLPKLLAEVEAGSRPRYGFTFIDADKLNNAAYFDLAVKMSLPSGTVYVDNIVQKGRLAAEGETHAEGVVGARKVVEQAGKDQRVDAVVLQTVNEKNYDGFLLAVVK
ncbi:MAG: hypothetical protein M4579_002885 [Chaenotheca gracillima]|nr:MAG: hypothetical protein M4579_002885 [Chaenotheca gracillima]